MKEVKIMRYLVKTKTRKARITKVKEEKEIK